MCDAWTEHKAGLVHGPIIGFLNSVSRPSGGIFSHFLSSELLRLPGMRGFWMTSSLAVECIFLIWIGLLPESR
jgi:hypothetical protein